MRWSERLKERLCEAFRGPAVELPWVLPVMLGSLEREWAKKRPPGLVQAEKRKKRPARSIREAKTRTGEVTLMRACDRPNRWARQEQREDRIDVGSSSPPALYGTCQRYASFVSRVNRRGKGEVKVRQQLDIDLRCLQRQTESLLAPFRKPCIR